MDNPWRVLLVDDEEDIHMVTQLALKRKKHQERPFALTQARSAREARKIIADIEHPFDIAIIDVVMESDKAGVDLARSLRADASPTRIVLRTGRVGKEAEEELREEVDMDGYIAKGGMTATKLYDTVCRILGA